MAKHRLQFDFSEKALEDLDNLQELTDLPNRAEVIRQALRLLQWTIHETQDNGRSLVLKTGDRQQEVIFPFWKKSTRPAGAQKADK